MKVPLVLSAFVAIAVSSGSALSESLKVGVINLQPWGYVEDGVPAGQHIETFNVLSERSGVSFEYSVLPIPRIKKHLETGKVDMTIIFRREDMEKYVEFIGLVLPYNYYLVGKEDESFDPSRVAALKAVGHVRGEEDVAKQCFSDKYNPSAKMVPASDYGNLLKMLDGGRFDAATIPSKGLKAYLDKTGHDESKINELFVLCLNEAFLQISRKSKYFTDEVIGRLRDALSSMRNDGKIDEIAAKYREVSN